MSEHTALDHLMMNHSNLTMWQSELTDAIRMGDWIRVGKVKEELVKARKRLDDLQGEIDINVLDQFDSDVDLGVEP